MYIYMCMCVCVCVWVDGMKVYQNQIFFPRPIDKYPEYCSTPGVVS